MNTLNIQPKIFESIAIPDPLPSIKENNTASILPLKAPINDLYSGSGIRQGYISSRENKDYRDIASKPIIGEKTFANELTELKSPPIINNPNEPIPDKDWDPFRLVKLMSLSEDAGPELGRDVPSDDNIPCPDKDLSETLKKLGENIDQYVPTIDGASVTLPVVGKVSIPLLLGLVIVGYLFFRK